MGWHPSFRLLRAHFRRGKWCLAQKRTAHTGLLKPLVIVCTFTVLCWKVWSTMCVCMYDLHIWVKLYKDKYPDPFCSPLFLLPLSLVISLIPVSPLVFKCVSSLSLCPASATIFLLYSSSGTFYFMSSLMILEILALWKWYQKMIYVMSLCWTSGLVISNQHCSLRCMWKKWKK